MSSFAAHEGTFASRRFLSSSLRRRMQSGVEGGKVFKVSGVLGAKGSQRSKGLKLPLRFEGTHEFVRWRTHRLSGFKEVGSGHDAHRTRINFEGEVSKSFSLRRLLPLRHTSFDCIQIKKRCRGSIAFWRPFGWDIQKMSPAQGKSGGAQDSGEGGCSTPIRTGTERTKNSSANHYTMEQTFCRNISVLRGKSRKFF